MAEHFDGKGHHRKPRPYAPHNNLGLIKLARLAPLNALPLGSSDDELLETMVVENGCSDSGMWYVDTSGCGMLQANDAEPPPRRGWLRNAIQCAAVFLLGLMLLTGTASCNKDPQPTPEPIPTDTITPVNPGDTITPTPGGDTLPPVTGGTKEYLVDFYLSAGPVYPSLDSVREWSNVYDTIYLRVRATSDAWTPGSFHVARDSLSPYFDVSSKVYGKGWWRMYQILDDSQLGNISVKGMIRSDSAYFASKGYGIYPQVTGKNAKSAQPPRYNGNRIQRAGRSH